MSKDAQFWDKATKKYSKSPIANQKAYEHKLEKTQEYITPQSKLLEIGCGTGGTAIIHSKFAKHIHATDFSQNMIAIAKDRATAAKIDNVTFECIDIDSLNLKENSMDGVLALSILHLLDDKDVAVEKIYKTLKPGGFLASSTVCIGDSMKFMKWIAPVAKKIGLFPLLRVFSSQDLENSLKKHNFNIEYKWWPTNKKNKKGMTVFIIATKPL